MLHFEFVFVQLIVLIAVIWGSPIGSGNPQNCTIPNEKDEGECVIPKQCPAFQELVANASRLDFIRDLQCGGLICCPWNGRSYQKPWMPINSRLIGSRIVEIDEFPWIALLIYQNDASKCGGVLINRNFVLTAAHCLIGELYDPFGPLKFVRLREYNRVTDPDCVIIDSELDCIEGGKLDKDPLSIKIHPDYSPESVQQHHDIGLIEINLTEEYTDFLRPICLPENDSETIRGNLLTTSGFGMTDFFQTERFSPSPIKLKTKLSFVDPVECQDRYPAFQLGSGQICAGGKRANACFGDSGLPLMFYDRFESKWLLIGIASMKPPKCDIDNAGIYTSVVKYLPWIKKELIGTFVHNAEGDCGVHSIQEK